MEVFNAYEVLDELAMKSKMFEMIRDEFLKKDEKIAELEAKNDELQKAIIELSIVLGGMV